jgi:polynucleotide 5'-hydroxyl-kinase GRC3/NOL9
MLKPSIEVPDHWRRIPFDELAGTVLVLGEGDAGKSTFTEWLLCELEGRGRPPARLDGDIGQTSLGIPGTMTLVLPSGPSGSSGPSRPSGPGKPRVPDGPGNPGAPGGRRLAFFVGSTSPRGHMLPMLVGMRRLLDIAQPSGAETTVIDTTGMVRGQAGVALKEWKIQMIRPGSVVALQRGDELEPILTPLRKEGFTRIIDLPVAQGARQRSVVERQEHRRRSFREGLEGAVELKVQTTGLPVYAAETAVPGSLLGFLDARGLCRGTGVLMGAQSGEWTVLSTVPDPRGIASIRVGKVRIDPQTGIELGSRSVPLSS